MYSTLSIMKSHFAYIDGLRALAALFVVANHAFRMVWPNVPAVPVEQHPDGVFLLLTSWMRYGHFAVTAFIAISGFCLIYPYAHGTKIDNFRMLTFYGRRAWRILPTYYNALGLSLLLIWLLLGEKTGTQWDACLPVTVNGIIVRLLLLQDIFLVNQINNPFWSVATEFRIYILMPVIVFLYNTFGPLRMVISITACIVGLQSLHLPYFGHITFRYLCVFAMGCYAAYLARKESLDFARNLLRLILVACFGMIIGLFVILSYDASLSYWPTLDYFVGVSVSLLLLYCHQFSDCLINRVLCLPRLAFVGRYSYSIYLMHFPFQALIWIYFIVPFQLEKEIAFTVFLLVGTPAVLIFSWIFYRICEKPVLDHRPLRLNENF